MARGQRQPFRGLSIVRELPHGAKTYYTIADTRTVKQYAVVAGQRTACSSCRSVTCKHAAFVSSLRPATPAERSEASKALIAEFDAMAARRRGRGKYTLPAWLEEPDEMLEAILHRMRLNEDP